MLGTVSFLDNYGLKYFRKNVSFNCARKVSCENFRVYVSYIQKFTASLTREGSKFILSNTAFLNNMLSVFVLCVIKSVHCSLLSYLER